MDPYRISRIIVATLFICISVVLVYLFFGKANTKSEVGRNVIDFINTAKDTITFQRQTSCAPVINSCEMEVTKEEAMCHPGKLSEEIKKEMAQPLANKSCIEILDKMKSQCLSGCVFAPESLMTVSGDVSIQVSYKDSKTNNVQILSPGMKIPEHACSATGKRVVNLKADCR